MMTPEWVTEALGPELLDGAQVTGVSITSLSEGVGFIGEVSKLVLTYDDRPDEAPEAVIAKIPIGDPGGRMIGTMMRLYERESIFYASMAHELQLRVPRSFYNGADTETGDFCLLLEDLGHLSDARPARWRQRRAGDNDLGDDRRISRPCGTAPTVRPMTAFRDSTIR